MENQLEKARDEINRIDREMAHLFEQRMKAAEQVIAYKREHNLPVLDSAREKTVIEKNTALIESPVLQEYYQEFIKKIMSLSREYQRQISGTGTVAYQGVEGAYSHITLKKLFPFAQEKACATFQEVFCAIANGKADCGVVPFENSYTGEVEDNLENLSKYPVYISEIFDLKIRHNLLALESASLSDIKEVYSHPQALSQCKDFLDNHQLAAVPYLNTAVAAKYISAQKDKSKAAIASAETAKLYQLSVLAEDISISSENTTRFIVITKRPGAGGNHFSLMFTVDHRAGSLADVMQIIAQRGFNMDSIHSKALHDQPWQYYFYVELLGNASSEEAKELLKELKLHCKMLKFLGGYDKE